MATLSYNEITPKTLIEYNGEPYEVQSSHVFRVQQSKPVNQTKLKHLVSGKVQEITFHQNESVEEADVDTMDAHYLYTNRGESWFAEDGNSKNRFSFPEEAVANETQWLTENAVVKVLIFKDEPFSVRIPIKLDLKVAEAPPSLKGDTASGGNKQVVLESGATVTTPLFINVDDIIRVNTETGQYAERVEKA